MKYNNVIVAEFISRENRFVATVRLGGEEIKVHVKNTGRCRELLIPGCRVYLTASDNIDRKMKYDLIAVEKVADNGTILINMDSFCPNLAVEEWLPVSGRFSAGAVIRREYTYGDSRFDFYVVDGEDKYLIEVKGVTLESGGVVRFPDAPTERGRKHLIGLTEAVKAGYRAMVIFVVQMSGVKRLCPNSETDPLFADALRRAIKAGVTPLALTCEVAPDRVEINAEIPVDPYG